LPLDRALRRASSAGIIGRKPEWLQEFGLQPIGLWQALKIGMEVAFLEQRDRSPAMGDRMRLLFTGLTER
jgi:hypothetical protein